MYSLTQWIFTLALPSDTTINDSIADLHGPTSYLDAIGSWIYIQ